MSDLLTGVVRKTKPVKLSSRTVHVRQLTGVELLGLEDSIEAAKEDKPKVLAAQVAAYLSDEQGNAALTAEQALQFVGLYAAIDTKRVIRAGDALNSLKDDAVEEAAKN